MSFESVSIQTTRNGSSLVSGYREDLAAADVVAASLTSTVGVTSVLWELVGRPEYSGAGGAGPEPIALATAPTCSFTVDSDSGAVHLDGTYLLRATINPGSPGQVRKTVDLVRLSSLTIPGMSGVRHLRKLACFESLEDTSVPTILQGWATQANRWFDLVKTIALGGGVIETLSGAYGEGLSAADQTLNLSDANGGGVVINGAAGGFTGASAIRINTAAAGPFVVDRVTGNIGIGIGSPLEELHVKSASPGLRLDRTGGAAISLENITDVLNLINRTGPVTIATFPGTGGMRTDFGVGIGAAAPTAAALAMGAGSGVGVSAASTGRIRYNEISQLWEASQNGAAYVPMISAGASPGTVITGAPSGTTNLGALTSGNLQQTVSLGVATVVSTVFAAGAVAFGSPANGTLTQDSSNLVWDDTNNRLGIGTITPTVDLDVTHAQSAVTAAQVANTSAGTLAVAQYVARNAAGTAAWGLTGSGFAAVSPDPNLGASTAFLVGPTVYVGSAATISFQTGATRAERVRVDNVGVVSISNLNAGGMVKATAATGALVIATPGTDFMVPAAPLTSGSVLFANGSGQIAQDNAQFFWDDTNHRLGIGTATPASDLSISRSASSVVGINVANANAGAAAVAAHSASNGTSTMSVGITGTGFTGGGSTPNLGASTTFLNAAISGPLYLGSIGIITMQTGPTQAERVRILATGEVQLSSLSTGGMVKAAAGGQLGVGVAGTDFLAPPGGGLTAGSVLFGGAAGAVAQDNAQFFWDDTNHRLGIGTTTPAAGVALDIIQSNTLTAAARISNSNTSTTASAVWNASNGGTATAAFGMTGINWVEAGGSTLPNRVANQTFITTALPGPAPSIYIGSHGTVTLQTGSTQQERLRIASTGAVTLSSLAGAGGFVVADATGLLSVTTLGGPPAPVVTITAGTGMTGGGPTSANMTLNVIGNADGSILANVDDVQVGVLATDAQHGNRGGGGIHSVATTSVNGFFSAADKTILQNARFLVQTTTNAPASAFSLGALASGVLQHVVTGIISAPTSLAVVGGQIPFGNASGSGLLAQDANLFWDSTDHRLGIGTQIPAFDIDVLHTQNATTAVRVSNLNAGAAALVEVGVINNLATPAAMGITGGGWTSGGSDPNLGASVGFLLSNSWYVGAVSTISFQTGATKGERLKISSTGNVTLSSLAAGGLVKAAGGGQLGIGLVTTTDITDLNVTMGKLEPIGPSKILGNDGPATQSPFDISVIAPLTMVPGSGDLTFATGFAAGSVVFQGASQIADDHASFFWDLTNHRLGIGNTTPGIDLDVRRSTNGPAGITVQNTNAGIGAQAFVSASNGSSSTSFGSTGTGYTAVFDSPNLGANTGFVLGLNLYVGADGAITFQTGSPQAEVLRLLATGEVIVPNKLAGGTAAGAELVLEGTTDATHKGHVRCADPLGVGRSAGVLGGAPMFAVAGSVAVNSSAGASLDYVVVNTSTVNISGSTPITNAGGFNWVTIQAPVYNGTIAIGAGGFAPPAATLCIEGPPTVAGGASFNNGSSLGPLALWAKGSANIDGSLDLNNNLNMNGTINVGTNGVFLGNLTANGLVSSGSSSTVDARAIGSFLVGTSPTWAIKATVDAGPSNPKVGFFSATPIVQPTVSGSRIANPALASLLTSLANIGLINDFTSP